ncbi:MAG: S46 family peptidase [Bacteroidales bacterium]|jgi:hypothetical protein|nr:S46 family peptidase [Bacteroidales bacterium]
MKRLLILTLFLTLAFSNIRADEGMWLPSLIKERFNDMKKNGFKLTASDLYDINKASLKDAIVHFGGGCTGELISGDGLLITNHHCGFGQIQSHSSVQNDYLKDGFWAMSREEELPNRGLTVRFLVRMEDVTLKVLQNIKDGATEEERIASISKNSAEIIDAAKKGNHYDARVESLYYGNQYFLFIYETYTDVRLVGAPPSSIGKFGGDTDNWMWPRHTGDFSLFRIYAGKDNMPAPYSKENVPYKPKKFFSISTSGVNEGDFTLVYGFPGRTQEYLYSEAVRYISDISNPHKIHLRTLRLDIQNEEMSKSQEVRIKYASKNASVANAWKKWQGEAKGIIKMNAVGTKKEYEKRFSVWAASKPDYKGILDSIAAIYNVLEPYSFANDYLVEAINSNEIIRFAGSIKSTIMRNSKMSPELSAQNIKELALRFYKDYDINIDEQSFKALLAEYQKNVPTEFQPEFFKELLEKFGCTDNIVSDIFASSIFVAKDKVMSILDDGVTQNMFDNDPAVLFYQKFNDHFNDNIKPIIDRSNSKLAIFYRKYMRGQMEFDQQKNFYPDANSTLRITYGKVKGYSPADGIYYNHLSTLEGIMQKDNPDIYDYNIPQKLRDIYKTKDFGRWAINGTVPVCFVASNHTSGGNSGSPVINAEGNLVGINFDRVWEGTMSDIVYDPEICRNISLDVRYVLFVIDKVAGAGHLLNEMKLVK